MVSLPSFLILYAVTYTDMQLGSSALATHHPVPPHSPSWSKASVPSCVKAGAP